MDIKSSFELARRSQREKRLEDILFAYPHLIDSSLLHPRRQMWLASDSRVDLQFELADDTTVIVEVKRGLVTLAAVRQLQRYRRHIIAEGKSFCGYLVGASLHAEAAAALRRTKAGITFKQLGKDVPTDIVVCQHCRRARDSRVEKCPQDGETLTL